MKFATSLFIVISYFVQASPFPQSFPEGAACQVDEDCSGALACLANVCAVDPSIVGITNPVDPLPAGAACQVDEDCSGALACLANVCAVDPALAPPVSVSCPLLAVSSPVSSTSSVVPSPSPVLLAPVQSSTSSAVSSTSSAVSSTSSAVSSTSSAVSSTSSAVCSCAVPTNNLGDLPAGAACQVDEDCSGVLACLGNVCAVDPALTVV
jgi:hypothetical protein